MSRSEYTHKLREASAKRTQSKRKFAAKFASISEEISAFYDSRRLTEADVDHMAETYSEGRVFNKNALRYSHE